MPLPCYWTELVGIPNIQQVFLSACLIGFVLFPCFCHLYSFKYLLSEILRDTQNANLTQSFDNAIFTCDLGIIGQNKQNSHCAGSEIILPPFGKKP